MDTQARTDLRRIALGITIASFSIAALMGVAALLGGSFGETEIRVLLTTVVVGCGSMLALCCLAAVGGRYHLVGPAGLLVVVGTTAFTLLMVWGGVDIGSRADFRAWGVALTATLSLAQVCLLLGVAGRRATLGLLMWATAGLVGLLAVLVSAIVLGWDAGEGAVRLVGVVAILDVLGTIVALALGIFGGTGTPEGTARTVRLSVETAARLDAEAVRTGRSVTDLVGDAVARYVAPTVG